LPDDHVYVGLQLDQAFGDDLALRLRVHR
jgi:hypothetical protein